MSLRPIEDHDIPEETARICAAAFPKGSLPIRLRDALGQVFRDAEFIGMFSRRGRPAVSPGRLALVSVLQFLEGLSDRQTADAVRGRIDWKYALGLELTDPGFDFSVLSEFRSRLIEAGPDRLLDLMLLRLQAAGLVKAGGRQRTDSTHVLAAIRAVNRLELVGETMRAALAAVAIVAPNWLAPLIEQGWAQRYGHRVEEYQLPKDDAKRLAYAETIGADGDRLLGCIDSDEAPAWLRELPAIGVLRRVWDQQFRLDEQGRRRWREPKDLPPSGERQASPYDDDARYGVKRGSGWVGYKAHLTETCEPDVPHVVVNVATTAAQVADNDLIPVIHARLTERDLLPDIHLIDSGYTGGELVVTSRNTYGIDLLGPAREDCSWQAKAGEGFDSSGFTIDWHNQTVTCPQGKTSTSWAPWRTKAGEESIHVDFSKSDCTSCPVRAKCTRAKREPRQLTLHAREVHETLQRNRAAQQTEAWKQQYALRSGIEGTISQAVRGFQLRRSRYLGLAKTHVQHVLTAAAINFVRIDAWLTGVPLSTSRRHHLEKLQTAVAA
ncbi:IS1182 family transposase [Streptosporangium brasiliense]|uniref:Transposase n=2 Tax=Streptosporangium TaxID=2000 RepID=A0ABT9R9U0_9ACTN|nr:IS1182 family transposase [Streptosporangium brasiliense]MDP9866022.1 transposase [Streptosporangium brasiliense]